MNISASRMFTIEALNAIAGFKWPDSATHAAMDKIGYEVYFYDSEPTRATSAFVSSGGYINFSTAAACHPDWKNSLITRAEFERSAPPALCETRARHDVVNHPSHYTQGQIECIDAIEQATCGLSGMEAICVGHVLRYTWRYKGKNGVEDLRKAQWYLNKLIAIVEKQNES